MQVLRKFLPDLRHKTQQKWGGYSSLAEIRCLSIPCSNYIKWRKITKRNQRTTTILRKHSQWSRWSSCGSCNSVTTTDPALKSVRFVCKQVENPVSGRSVKYRSSHNTEQRFWERKNAAVDKREATSNTWGHAGLRQCRAAILTKNARHITYTAEREVNTSRSSANFDESPPRNTCNYMQSRKRITKLTNGMSWAHRSVTLPINRNSSYQTWRSTM